MIDLSGLPGDLRREAKGALVWAYHHPLRDYPMDPTGPKTAAQAISAQITLVVVLLEGRNRLYNLQDVEVSDSDRAHYALVIRQAYPYIWRDGIVSAALRMPVPSHTVSETAFPHQNMVWFFENARHAEGFPIILYAVVVSALDGVLRVLEIGHVEHEGGATTHLCTGSRTKLGKYPEEVGGGYGWILGMLSFMNSKYTSKEAARLDRPSRKAMAKSGFSEPLIYSVAMREVDRAAASAANHSAVGTTREYHHRWWVRGHHRAQWFPSEKAHHVEWIAPYMKGAADAPMLPQKVYVMTR